VLSGRHRILKPKSKFILKIYFLFNSKLNGEKLGFNTSLSLTFSTKKKNTNTDKLVINWQNFAQVWLQLKFANPSYVIALARGAVFAQTQWRRWGILGQEIVLRPPQQNYRVWNENRRKNAKEAKAKYFLLLLFFFG